MAFVLAHFDVGEYDRWKQMFDSDPAGREESGVGHQVFRSVDEPGLVFVGVEFPSAEEAKSFRERLLASGALDNVTVKTQPTVVELTDQKAY